MMPQHASDLDRRWIAAHIPHQGRMCLLEQVRQWDPQSVECTTFTHRDPEHPLRSHGRLGSACLIEYAAQAVAVHGALLRSSGALPGVAGRGLLASARAVELLVPRVDDISAAMAVHVRRLNGDERGAIYDFEIHAGTACLARGRLGVVLT